MINLTNSGLEAMSQGLALTGIPEEVMCDCEHCDEMIIPVSAIRKNHRFNGEPVACFYKDANHLRNYTED
jgi:hypothetical protein